MKYPSVLVLDGYAFTRSVHVMMLARLGVQDILQAADGEQALRLLTISGGVDIVLCDLSGRGLEHLEFLQHAAKTGLVRAVALCSTLQPSVCRALERTALLVGLELLGVMTQPMQLRPLHRMIQHYRQRRESSTSIPAWDKKKFPLDEIRRGLSQGEFQAWYQPKLNMTDDTLEGVEALVRWVHPTMGLLLPKEFLVEIVEHKMIEEMFSQVLDQGLSLMESMRQQGINVEIALNLHASQLDSDEIFQHIQYALNLHGLPASALTFEIAEAGLFELHPKSHENLLRLRMLGCGLAIDNFGLGFSSLQLLCHLPFSQIKLDKKFVNTMNHPVSRAMLSSTLALARSLNMSLVIEGVSSEWVRDSLLQMGCNVGQGFFLRRPMNAAELRLWLLERKVRCEKKQIVGNILH